ncbi:MAG: lamin tail domain-containing protein [Patescibacteria group bacterium]
MKYVPQYIFLFAVFFLSPHLVHANIVINEIAWMGTTVSASDEWIELYNNGVESVDLLGWTLIALDGDPSVTLSGTIAAGTFYILERTDDESAPDVSADLIYSGTLGNTGEILTLYDSTHTVIDTAVGGSNWSLGGNNTTKHTAQRQTDASWITGTPTPKAENSVQDTGSGGTGSTGGTTSKPKITGGYKQVVFAYAGDDVTVPAGAHVTFEGYAVNDKNESLSGVHYTWTFGDGDTKSGKDVTHAYREPGMYVAVFSISSNNQKSKDERMVTVVSADIVISHVVWGEEGFIELLNTTGSQLDISDWKIYVEYRRRSGMDRTFTFPENTFLISDVPVKFSAYTTGLRPEEGDEVSLLYPNERRVTEYENVVVGTDVVEMTPITLSPILETAFMPDEVQQEEKKEATTSEEEKVSIVTASSVVASVRESTQREQPLGQLLFFTLCIVAGLGVLYVVSSRMLATPKMNVGELRAEDFTIIDTTPKET